MSTRSWLVLSLCCSLWSCSPPAPGIDGGQGGGGDVTGGGGGAITGGGGGAMTGGGGGAITGGGGGATGGGGGAMTGGGGGATGGGGGSTGGGGGTTGGGGGDAGVIVSCSPTELATCSSSTSVRSCNSAGNAYVETTCTNGRACTFDGGANASCACVRGFTECFNNDVYEFDSCGNRLGLVQDCLLSNEESCRVFDDGVRCSRAVTCTSDTNCANRDHCENGLCVPDVCNPTPPGDRNFCNGETVTKCRANGAAYDVVERCGATDAGEVCLTLGTTPYADCRCKPNARQGCSNSDIYWFDSCGNRGTLVSYCAAPRACSEGPTGPLCQTAGSCTNDLDCGNGEFCGAGACTPWVCMPGSEQCSGLQAQRCDPRGTRWEAKDDCVNGEVCGVGAGVASCRCAMNARQGCSGGAVYQYDSCGVRGTLVTTCAASTVCAEAGATASCVTAPPAASCLSDSFCGGTNVCLDGACSLQVCAPNAQLCEAGSVRLCDSRGAGSTFVAQCEDGARCTVSGSTARCSCTPNARLGCLNGDVYQFDSCGTAGSIIADCGSAACVESATSAICAQRPVDGGTDAGNLCTPRSRTGCYLGDLYFFDACNHIDGIAEDCAGSVTCNTIGGPAACRSSVADAGSPYWSRACPLVQDVENPTLLEADCRCFVNRAPTSGIPRCVGLNYVPVSTRFGTGPTIRTLPQAHFNGGVVIGRELFVGADWSSSTRPVQGLVMAVHLDTGARRIVSGAYEDPSTGFAETGTGPSFFKVIDVKERNGQLFALSVPTTSASLEIIRVDPTTGARTLVWRARDMAFGQCASGDPARLAVTYHERVFGLDANGGFYLAFRGAGSYSEGVGLVRVASDGMSCSFVTRSGAGALNAHSGRDVGGGYTVDRGYYSGFVAHQGSLFVLNDALLALFRIDPMTGARTRVSSASTSLGVLGAGPINLGGIGQRWLAWDAARSVMWATGVQSYRALTAVDLTSGDRTEATCRTTNATVPWRNTCLGGVLEGGFQNFGGFWLDPANGDPIVVHENHSFVRVDLRNGNSLRFSQ